MPADANEPVLPTSWMQVLEKIERSLEQTIKATAEREQTWQSVPEPEGAALAREARWRELLQKLGARPHGFEECAPQLEQEASEVDTTLAAGAEEVSRCRAAAAETARRLAEWLARAI